MLNDLTRKLLIKYSQKVGAKRSIKSSVALFCGTIEELHMKVADSILNELIYESPAGYAEECKAILSVNFLEIPAFHKYIEMSATKDIYINSLGIVNELYISKAKSHARGRLNTQLVVDMRYFFESYENALQLIGWLKNNSSKYGIVAS